MGVDNIQKQELIECHSSSFIPIFFSFVIFLLFFLSSQKVDIYYVNKTTNSPVSGDEREIGWVGGWVCVCVFVCGGMCWGVGLVRGRQDCTELCLKHTFLSYLGKLH